MVWTDTGALAFYDSLSPGHAPLAFDRTSRVIVRGRDDYATFKALVRPFAIVVSNVFSNGQTQVRFAKQYDPATLLALDKARE